VDLISRSAPPFELPDHAGKIVRLEDYRGKKTVVLVFNRGFF
jgi:peroxiredoxin